MIRALKECLVIAVVMASATAMANGQKGTDLTPKQIFEKCHDSVVTVVTDKSQGTGFFVKNGLLIATCYHVIKNAKSIEVQGTKGAKWQVGAVYFDKSCDAALLKLTDETNRKPIQIGEYAKLATGDPLYVIGNPLGLEQTLTNGIMSAKRRDGNVDLIQTTAAISPGSSGSPVLNAKGQFVGFASFHFAEGQLLNMAVSSSAVVRLWGEDSIPISTFYASAKTSVDSDDEEKGTELKTKYTKEVARKMLNEQFPKFFNSLAKQFMRWDYFWHLECTTRTKYDVEDFRVRNEKEYNKCLDPFDEFPEINQVFHDSELPDEHVATYVEALIGYIKSGNELFEAQVASIQAAADNKGQKAADERYDKAYETMRNHLYKLSIAYLDAAEIRFSTFRQLISPAVVFENFGITIGGIFADPEHEQGCYVSYGVADLIPDKCLLVAIGRVGESAFKDVSNWIEVQEELKKYPETDKKVQVRLSTGKIATLDIIRPD